MSTTPCGTAALSPSLCPPVSADWPGVAKATLRVIVVVVMVLVMTRMLADGYTIPDTMLVVSTAAGITPVVVGGVASTVRLAPGWPLARISRRALS
jgi:hypothetical protein